MISWKRIFAELEAQEAQQARLELVRRLEEAFRFYAEALAAFRQQALRACPPLAEHYAATLAELEDGARAHGVAAERHDEFLSQAARFGDEAAREYESRADDIRELVRLLALATESFALRTGDGRRELTQFAHRIETIAAMPNPVELRRELRLQVAAMRQSLERMAKEDEQTLEKMRSELQALKQRLAAAEALISRDPVTQLANRSELMRQMELRVRRKSTFCIVHFHVMEWERLSAGMPEPAAQVVLLEFAKRLSSNLRVSDVAARCASAHFVVLMDCGLQEALIRSRQLHMRVCGRYEVDAGRGRIVVAISANMTVTEYDGRETMQALLERAGIAALTENLTRE